MRVGDRVRKVVGTDVWGPDFVSLIGRVET